MNMRVEPVERDGQFWVTVSVDGSGLKPRGPFLSNDEAQAMVERLRWYGRALSEAAHG